ncbi:polysaccharide pyruvyl transferase family protein [Pararoseomonas indoligenes]|uniref:Polysaccharide pyruvyl transferase family protein n=1 Tax=Roseomonas indoligenes TaxID=2820811 RepID=A0A940N5W3_9PROT|nr:polysaccharide pyruvyl transferase family protein [Pararoseomonas indoligenes]MBP0495695.1 polysaccharide pyruvyl transferase family protein [Pararoseomonas indoligenes]
MPLSDWHNGSGARLRLIARLQRDIYECIRNEISEDPFAIVDFPDIRNPGDSAIWMGQIRYLAAMHRRRPAFLSKMRDFSADDLIKAVPSGPIFIQGGGTFGDIWVGHQNFREYLMERFPDRRIIQFPQSIHFKSAKRLEQAKRAIERHGNFVLLVRDSQSEWIARRHFNCDIRLCPDMAFWMGPVKPLGEVGVPVLCVLREDKERARPDHTLAPDMPAEDWINEAAWKIKAAKAIGYASAALVPPFGEAQFRALDSAAHARVSRGFVHLSRARAIVTDRLHVHIFCLLLGQPHAVLDNSYGKVRAFMETFSGGTDLSHQTNSIQDAIDWARFKAGMAKPEGRSFSSSNCSAFSDIASLGSANEPSGGPLLTFIIPVRHPANARDWTIVKANLAQTVGSIANQTHPDWHAVIIANKGSDLPDLPEKFSVCYVRFPPNKQHERGKAKSREAFWDAFRVDKGRRVTAGMLTARDSAFFMIVDDDDFVSSQIVNYVAAHRASNGWKIDRGYVWNSGGRLLMATEEFGRLCGTSLIVRSTLYDLPAKVDEVRPDFITDMVGSHRRIEGILAERGTPLAKLPFRGAVYRVASPTSHSRTPSIWTKYSLNRKGLKQPLTLLRNAAKLRLITARIRKEFGLPAATS